MSGFFALRRSTFEAGRDFNPVGYKIGLELIIKCRCQLVAEVPIHFSDRRLGKSKLSLKEQLRYLKHIRRLYNYKYGTWSHLAQFLVVGASGLAREPARADAPAPLEPAREARHRAARSRSRWCGTSRSTAGSASRTRGRSSIVRQFVGLRRRLLGRRGRELLRDARPVGRRSGTSRPPRSPASSRAPLFNFVANRFFVFRHEHVKPVDEP